MWNIKLPSYFEFPDYLSDVSSVSKQKLEEQHKDDKKVKSNKKKQKYNNSIRVRIFKDRR